jgi:hypothetical protein
MPERSRRKALGRLDRLAESIAVGAASDEPDNPYEGK